MILILLFEHLNQLAKKFIVCVIISNIYKYTSSSNILARKVNESKKNPITLVIEVGSFESCNLCPTSYVSSYM